MLIIRVDLLRIVEVPSLTRCIPILTLLSAPHAGGSGVPVHPESPGLVPGHAALPATSFLPRGARRSFERMAISSRAAVSKQRPPSAAGAAPDTTRNNLCSDSDHPLALIAQKRAECRATAAVLNNKAKGVSNQVYNTLAKAEKKVANCGTVGVFRAISDAVAHGVGRALCKCRICPNCQYLVSRKRRRNLMLWFDLNEQALKSYRFYQLVLTMRHSAKDGIREGVYTSELLANFNALRGGDGNRAARQWWDKRIAGGTFSVEVISARMDDTGHIHLHVLLICAPGDIPIWRADGRESAFGQQVKARWAHLTGDAPKRVHIEPAYFLEEAENGDRTKVYYDPAKHDTSLLRKAVAECAKYTIKSDSESLEGLSPAFLADLLDMRNRYYGRFGIMSKNSKGSAVFAGMDMLRTDFKDLAEVEQRELEQLYNPETGEVVRKEDTRLALSYYRNTRPRSAPLASIHSKRGEMPRGGEKYYTFRSQANVVYYGPDEVQKVAIDAARTLRQRYVAGNDVGTTSAALFDVGLGSRPAQLLFNKEKEAATLRSEAEVGGIGEQGRKPQGNDHNQL